MSLLSTHNTGDIHLSSIRWTRNSCTCSNDMSNAPLALPALPGTSSPSLSTQM